MPDVLAKVTARALDVPRGPDVTHRIRVPRAWLESGELVELELPRNLTCAACAGGGCDACERAGAISLRGRQEPPEILTVTLPKLQPNEGGEPRAVMIRIPEQGGLAPDQGEILPRGLLLLRVEPGAVADPGVARVAPAARSLSQRVRLSLRIPAAARGWARVLAVAALIVLLVGLAILAFRRHRGLG
ncbi:MAG TPA: hypothetical protein VFK05_28395 [Polyangiaceae bacterium]|nr:hypothetical protein [Polyangiaceae bacterium]